MGLLVGESGDSGEDPKAWWAGSWTQGLHARFQVSSICLLCLQNRVKKGGGRLSLEAAQLLPKLPCTQD